jgi:hypothetical protein
VVPRAVPPELVQDVATTLAAAADPFGVSPEQWELVEGNLFGASLLPYLAFLYFLVGLYKLRIQLTIALGSAW